MFLSGSQMETISTGATCTKRHKSLFPYQPAPINPTRLVLPFTISSASAPNDGRAASAVAEAAVFRKLRRLILKAQPAPDGANSTGGFGICASMHFVANEAIPFL